jgi:hypothetical protein
MNFQSSQAKQKQKKFPQNLIKSWDVTDIQKIDLYRLFYFDRFLPLFAFAS